MGFGLRVLIAGESLGANGSTLIARDDSGVGSVFRKGLPPNTLN